MRHVLLLEQVDRPLVRCRELLLHSDSSPLPLLRVAITNELQPYLPRLGVHDYVSIVATHITLECVTNYVRSRLADAVDLVINPCSEALTQRLAR